MAWRDRVGRPATFRGVPFRVDESEHQTGRKTVTHVYPLRDEPFVEDLGRRPRTFHVTGYVIGDDYLQQRDALVGALEAPGPGILVHPYHGSRLVAATGEVRIHERREEGAIAYVSVEFTETDARPISPVIARASAGAISETGTAAQEAGRAAFLRAYQLRLPPTAAPGVRAVTKPLPGFSFRAPAAMLTSWSTRLRTALARITQVEGLASLKRQFDGLVTDGTLLVRDPLVLVTRIGQIFRELGTWPRTPRLGLDALLAAYRSTASPVPRPTATTASRAAERANYDAVDAFLRTEVLVAAATQATAAADVPSRAAGGYDHHDDAVAAREEILVLLDAHTEVADDAVYDTLQDLRAALIAAVPGEGRARPRLVAITPIVTTPALVLAYRLYDGLDLADDLATRNRVRHPGFVPGGQPLEVLSRA